MWLAYDERKVKRERVSPYRLGAAGCCFRLGAFEIQRRFLRSAFGFHLDLNLRAGDILQHDGAVDLAIIAENHTENRPRLGLALAGAVRGGDIDKSRRKFRLGILGTHETDVEDHGVDRLLEHAFAARQIDKAGAFHGENIIGKPTRAFEIEMRAHIAQSDLL
jgi:hypothetical protein